MLKLVFVFTLCLGVSNALAEGKEGHSGSGVICRDPKNGEPTSGELLDLVEAALPIPYLGLGMTVPHSEEDPDQQIDRALEKLRRWNPAFASEVAPALESIRRSPTLIPSGYRLAPGSDTETLMLKLNGKDGCRLELLGKYFDSVDTLFIDKNLLDVLPKTDRAALYLHEAIYKVYREHYGQLSFGTANGPMTLNDTSRIARRAVGYLFSSANPQPVEEAPAGSLHCHNAFVDFYLAGDQLHFSRLGVPVLAQTSAAGAGSAVQTVFPLLGEKISLRFQPPSATSAGRLETKGGFLQIPSRELECID